MRETIDLIVYTGRDSKTARPLTRQTKTTITETPISSESVSVLIPFDIALTVQAGEDQIVKESLICLAGQCLPVDWQRAEKVSGLFLTNAGYLIVFGRLVWTRQTVDLDLAVLKE